MPVIRIIETSLTFVKTWGFFTVSSPSHILRFGSELGQL
jgi:hypothetical protein